MKTARPVLASPAISLTLRTSSFVSYRLRPSSSLFGRRPQLLVLQETVTDGTGNLIQKIVYTIGHDHISQSTWRAGDVSPPSVAVFHFDGHGNTRILTDLAGSIVTLAGLLQVYHYDAYGNALNFTISAATQYLYSGEQFDPRIGQQYLRARYYDSATGTFNRLDPFFGNTTDPQSFHKYLYTHGDPVNGWDPTGNFLVGLGISALVSAFGRSSYNSAVVSAGFFADAFIGGWLTWRGTIIGAVDDTRLNYGEGVGPIHHSVHSITIEFQAGTNMAAKLDEIYADLRDFKHFNDGVNKVADVRTDSIDGVRYAFFDSKGFFGLNSDLINPFEVPVRLWSDRSNRTVVADTAGAHMLVGQRRWYVRLLQGTTVEVSTETNDQERDTLNRIGVSVLRDGFGKKYPK